MMKLQYFSRSSSCKFEMSQYLNSFFIHFLIHLNICKSSADIHSLTLVWPFTKRTQSILFCEILSLSMSKFYLVVFGLFCFFCPVNAF